MINSLSPPQTTKVNVNDMLLPAKKVSIRALDGTTLPLRIWQDDPTKQPTKILQILHGMSEHSKRYKLMASLFARMGYLVIAHDHRGHGERDRFGLGHFGSKRGWQGVTEDVYSVNRYARGLYESVPIVLFGHSMGSYITLAFLQEHPTLADGVILSGSGFKHPALVRVLSLISTWENWRFGEEGRSDLIDYLSFGSFNKPFAKTGSTDFDWLSRDKDAVAEYVNDVKCGFTCTTQTWCDFSKGLINVFSQQGLSKLPKKTPYYLVSGTQDPVGSKGKGVEQLVQRLKSNGIERVEAKLYEGGRHELINELNKEEVMSDIQQWIVNNVGKKEA